MTTETDEITEVNSISATNRPAPANGAALAAIIVTAFLSAMFSLISVGHIAQRAEFLAASRQPVTVERLLAASRPIDIALLVLVIAALGVLVWLELKRRAISRLFNNMTSTSAVIILLTLVSWVGHAYLFPGVLLGGDSGSHVARFLEVRQALENGQLPQWTNYDYLGSPLLVFTGPLTYLVGGVMDLVLRNPVATAKVLLFSLHLASGFAFYAFMRRLGLSRVSALVSAIGFSGSFAHLHLFLYRGVFPQAFTILFLVVLFHAAEGLMRGPRFNARDWLFFAFATFGLIANHQPHALFAAFYLGLFGGSSLIVARWRISGLPALVSAGMAGVVASAFAVLPIIWEGDWVMIEPENGLFGFQLPTLSRISQLFLWHITRQNWGTDYWAYLGLGLIILAMIGLSMGFRGKIDRESRQLVLAILPCLFFLPFLYNPVVRDIIFILFFVAILAGLGVEFLRRFTSMPRLILATVTLVFLDVAITSVQPVARTDKQFLIDIGRFLQTTSPNERFMELDFDNDQAIKPDIGPGAGPISAFTAVQRIAGSHNMAATRVHNYAEAIVERVGGDLIRNGVVSQADLTLLSLLNVTRIVCVNSFNAGCPGSYVTNAQAPALGRYISVPNASPVLFSRRLVDLVPQAFLDKPMVWSESFQPQDPQVQGLYGFLEDYLSTASIETDSRSAKALPVRQRPKQYSDLPDTSDWHPTLEAYSVDEQHVRLVVHADQSGYVQVAHPWYPGNEVLDNGLPIDPLQGALNLVVIPLTPGDHTIEIRPASTRIESVSMAISAAALIGILAIFAGAKFRERASRTAGPLQS